MKSIYKDIMEDITQKPIAEIAEEWQKIGLDVGELSAKRANFLLQNSDWLAMLAYYQSGNLANQKTETRIWKYQSGEHNIKWKDLNYARKQK